MIIYTLRVLPLKEYPGCKTLYYVSEEVRNSKVTEARALGYEVIIGKVKTED